MSVLALNEPSIANTLSPVFANIGSLGNFSTMGDISAGGIVSYGQGLLSTAPLQALAASQTITLTPTTSGTLIFLDLSGTGPAPCTIFFPASPGTTNQYTWDFIVRESTANSGGVWFRTPPNSSMYGIVNYTNQPGLNATIGTTRPIALFGAGGNCNALFGSADQGSNLGVRVGDMMRVTQYTTPTTNTIVLTAVSSYPNGITNGSDYFVLSVF